MTLLIDPYLSRVPLRGLRPPAAGAARPGAARPLPAARPGEVAGVLVGHTHFDHAVDAPAIARRFGCTAYGSSSLVDLMALHGLAERAVEVEPYRTLRAGPVRGQLHPERPLEAAARPRGPLRRRAHLRAPRRPRPRRLPLRPGLGHPDRGRRARLYHQGSANLIDDAVRERGVDVFLAGIAGRSFTGDYWERILPRLDPRVVVPTHYDDFFRPLGDPIGFSRTSTSRLPDESDAVAARRCRGPCARAAARGAPG